MPGITQLTVTSTEQVTPALVRLHFHSDDLSAFSDSTDTDRYVKVALPVGDETVVRTYTALEPDIAAGTLAIEFVVHGDTGVAGPWAAAAQPGDTVEVRGPGGGYRPSPDADWHLLAGDDSAIPAVRQALATLPRGAVAEVLLEVEDADHEVELPTPDGVNVTWVHRRTATERDPLVAAVRALAWREGRVHVFVHGEAQAVMHGLRPYLLTERQVPRQDASISGYWRRGRTEEGFRDWKKELAAAETAGT